MQEQISLLQANQTHPSGELSSIWSPSLSAGATKPPQIDIPFFTGDILKWKEFWDMFEASVHKEKIYAEIDKFICLKSKSLLEMPCKLWQAINCQMKITKLLLMF